MTTTSYLTILSSVMTTPRAGASSSKTTRKTQHNVSAKKIKPISF